MTMPVMDGTATIQALRRINPTVKIIAASGLNANGGLASGGGIKYFLTKPYTAETLLTTIRNTLDDAGVVDATSLVAMPNNHKDS